MHSYAVDSNERKQVPFFLTALAIFLAWLFHILLKGTHLVLPWWIDAPSVMGFYGLLYFGFDGYLWKMKIFHVIKVVRIPNINGIWRGYVISSFNQHGDKKWAKLKIKQRWFRISIILETDYSRSRSIAASISINEPYGIALNYVYFNEPKPHAENTMHAHRGSAELICREDSLAGEYYSGRDRQNYGTLFFERKKIWNKREVKEKG